MTDKRKKGFWTISKVVKITYTRRDDWEFDEFPATFKETVADAEEHLEDGFCDFGEIGMSFEPIAGEDWKEEDFEERDDDE